ncbi:MAG: hypothetical protein AAGI51_08010 [Pseudomonadota bacterium]
MPRAFDEPAPDRRSPAPWSERFLVEPPGRGRLRLDRALICARLAVRVRLRGSTWWMPAAALAVRGAIVSILDNVHHHGHALDDPQAGCNLRLPRPLEAAILPFNLHALHRRHPDKPWSEPPPLLEPGVGAYRHAFSKALLHPFRGLIPQRIAAAGARDLRHRAPGADLQRAPPRSHMQNTA